MKKIVYGLKRSAKVWTDRRRTATDHNSSFWAFGSEELKGG